VIARACGQVAAQLAIGCDREGLISEAFKHRENAWRVWASRARRAVVTHVCLATGGSLCQEQSREQNERVQ